MVEVLLAVYFGAGAIAAVVGVAMIVKAKKKKDPICLSCTHLLRYNKRPKHMEFRYHCDKCTCFDKCPDYCRYYTPRKEEVVE